MSLSDREQQVCRVIEQRRERMLDELKRHVAVPTGQSYRPGLDEYRGLLTQRLEAIGGRTELVPGDPRPWWLDSSGRRRAGGGEGDDAEQALPVAIVRSMKRGEAHADCRQATADSPPPRVLIAGHLDTVHDPHGSFRELSIQPDGKYATGPGVVDMKGGIVIAVNALEALAECGIDLNWTMLLNSDEETGSFQSARILREIATQHDIGIAIEPALADGSLAIERMGSGQFMIEVFGQSAHVGREFEKGVSAVTKLAEVLLKLAAMADPAEGRIVSVGPLRGGTVTNAVPDYAACWGNVRFRDPKAGEALGNLIEALAEDGEGQSPGIPIPGPCRVVVHRQWNRPAKPRNDAVQRFAESIRASAEDLGQSLPFASTGGVCDGNIMQAAGLPTLDTLGVRGGNLHRPDEFIELASLVERCQLLTVVLSRIAAGRVTV
jgi:glutamate carboxypeptidase